LQRNKYYFVNFCPDYIGLEKPRTYSEEIWQLVLIDLLPLEMFPKVHIEKIKLKKKTYLHLELYEHYKSGYESTVINGFKENTFALGLIILELAFNINIQDLYDDKYHSLKSKESDY
jgi:hypothetical protein